MTESLTVSASGTTPDAGPLPKAHKRLAISLLWGSIGSFFSLGAIPGVLLALQLQNADEAHKTTNLAVVGAIGALVSVLAQPFWGALSDRTRSRLGRRTPFLIGGALVTAGCLFAMASANTVVMIAVSWCLVQLFLAAVQGPFSAIIPDRVPIAVRGVFSAALGFGMTLGVFGGQILGSILAPRGFLFSYAILAVVILVAVGLFVIVNPDRSVGRAAERGNILSFIAKMWVNPRKHPDFAWAFWGRMLLLLGFFGVSTFQLFILQDYVGLGQAKALQAFPLVGAVTLLALLLSMGISGWLSDRIGRRKPFVFAAAIIAGIGLAVPFLMPTVPGMMLYGAITGLGFGCYQAVDAALVSQVLPAQDADAAKDLGIANISITGPQVIGPVLAGAIIANLGGYAPLFIIAFVLSVVGALCILPIKSVR